MKEKFHTIFASIVVALVVAPYLLMAAIDTFGSLPPFDHTADVGKVAAISPSGTIKWLTASSVTGAVVGATGATGDIPVFSDGTGKAIKDSGIPSANVVLVSRAVQAGTGLLVTNSGLLSSDITMSISSATGSTGPLATITPQTTKGDLVGYSTQPIRVASSTDGKFLISDSTATAGISYAYDHLGTPTGDTAPTGYDGETKRLSRVRSAAIALTSNTGCNVGAAACPASGGTQSITLTPGDWSCTAMVGYLWGSSTSVTVTNVSVSKTSNTLPATDVQGVPTAGESRIEWDTVTAPDVQSTNSKVWTLPPYQVTTAANLTLYLVAQATFTASTLSTWGSLECRRMR